MNTLKSVRFGIVCSVVLLLTSLGAQASEDLLTNPGFEEGSGNQPVDWKAVVGGYEQYEPAVVIFKWDNEVKETGQYSVMVCRKPGEGRPAR